VTLIAGLRVILRGALSAFACLLAIESTCCDVPGLYTDRVVLSDPTAQSVALARDVASFKVLLAARPSRTWSAYFELRIAGTDFEGEFRTLARRYTTALNAGAIVWVPNGTLGRETDRIIIRGVARLPSAQAGHRNGGFAQAVRVRVREGPDRGLEGWTIPDLMQREGSLSPRPE
jgi:hypothetical protein